MVTGSPDYTERTEIQGSYLGTLKTVAVDENGQLYALLKGQAGSVFVPVTLDSEGHIVAVMKGSDGAALQTVLTDDAGRMVTVLRDPESDHYAAIDENGYLGAILKAAADVNVQGSVAVDQNAKDREMQGSDGATLRTVAVDSNGQIIMVPRGQSGHYLAVDEYGFMSAVIKGLFEGNYKTLATDEEGNLIAKVTDPINIFGTTPYIGNAELAVRLGSISYWSRTGAIVMQESFQFGIDRWETIVGDPSGSFELTSEAFRSNGYACKIAATAVATSASHMVMKRYTRHGSYKGKVGLEFHVSGAPIQGQLEVSFHVYDGTELLKYDFQWDFEGGYLNYRNSAGDWIHTGKGASWTVDKRDWHSIKIVGDTENKKYVGIWFDDMYADLSGIDVYREASPGNPQIEMRIEVIRDMGDDPYTMYIDDIILTIAE